MGDHMDREGLRRLFDMTDRIVVVTGGTRGIGLALAEGYAVAGAKVVVASRKAQACDEAAQHLRDLGGEAIGVPTHLGNLEDLDRLVERTVDAFGGIDVVVNNAANALGQAIDQITPEAWAKSFDVNLRGPVFLVQKALPHLEASTAAAVLNVVSVGAFIFSPYVSMYAAGKAALMSFTRSMASEFAANGIRVNALAPGSTDTDMTRGNPPEFQERMADASLQRRIASADEMVGPALLLTSDAGSFITGQVLIADGGMTPR
jgi:NAD(P)-dependent dehydrogenase (short-subunit alcohol dehydrogenase family)